MAGGSTDAQIAQLLVEKGLVKSQLVFLYAVKQAGRSGDLQAGVYDLSPSLRPSQIVAALKQDARRGGHHHPHRGLAPRADGRLPRHHQAHHEPRRVRCAGAHAACRPDRQVRLPCRAAAGPQPGGLPLPRYLSDRCQRDRPPGDREAARHVRAAPHPGDSLRDRGPGADDRPGSDAGEHRRARGGARQGAADHRGCLPEPDQEPEGRHGGTAAGRPDAPVRAGLGGLRLSPILDWVHITWWSALQTGGVQVVLPEALAGYQTYKVKGLRHHRSPRHGSRRSPRSRRPTPPAATSTSWPPARMACATGRTTSPRASRSRTRTSPRPRPSARRHERSAGD